MRIATLTEDQKKENKTKTVVKHLNKMYETNDEFRKKKCEISREAYKKKKEAAYIEKNGSLDGFKVRKYAC